MSVPQALAIYREVGQTIFGRKRRRALAGMNVLAARYNYKNVESVVKSTVQKHCKIHPTGTCVEDKLMWEDDRDVENYWHLCQAYVAADINYDLISHLDRVCVTARVDEKNLQAMPLRTYLYEHHPMLTTPDPYGGVQDADFLIWEAGRATSAAPFYFKHFQKRGNGKRLRKYRDGGILVNNPSHTALNEVRNRYGPIGDGTRRNPALLLSIGTGIRGQIPFAEDKKELPVPFKQLVKQKLAVGKHLVMRYTEGESIHEALREDVQGEHKWYKRLNVDEGLGEMDLGDWRTGPWNGDPKRPGGATLTDMENAVNTYLNRDELHPAEWHLLPKTMIDHTAQKLVRQRFARASLAASNPTDHQKRWHTYRGRYAYGAPTDPWSDESSDGPHERSGKSATEASSL